jgi:hypothetical protein
MDNVLGTESSSERETLVISFASGVCEEIMSGESATDQISSRETASCARKTRRFKRLLVVKEVLLGPRKVEA